MIVENKTLVQNTRNEKNVSQKCIPSESQAKIHGFKILQNATCLESSAEYKICLSQKYMIEVKNSQKRNLDRHLNF